MSNNGDGLYYDYDALSSPIPERPFDSVENDFRFTLPSPNFTDLASFDNFLSSRLSTNPSPAKPFIDNTNYTDFGFLEDIRPPQLPQMQPKPKPKKLVFQPFLSFDATEITVKALRERISQKK